jgi:hypothetical protein
MKNKKFESVIVSFSSYAGGFLSLNLGTHSSTFPLMKFEENDFFNLKVIGKASAEILSCIADRIVYENNNLIPEPGDFFLTDSNWVSAIARPWAGFFTPNTEANRAKFMVGNNVIFPDGDKQVIDYVSEGGPYLNIWVDGEILNPKDVGLPSKFEVTQ